jgi:hypothetical protein
LAKAKELGWCVHKLEEVELDKLADVSIWDMFHKVDSTDECTVCWPVVENS